MKKLTGLVLSGAMLASMSGPLVVPAVAQHNRYYEGARRSRVYDDRHDRDYYNKKAHSGIGPGKGAAIGGVAGAALGAVFGGGVKGALIGGAAGAGVGALAGKAAENNRHRKYCDWRDPRC